MLLVCKANTKLDMVMYRLETSKGKGSVDYGRRQQLTGNSGDRLSSRAEMSVEVVRESYYTGNTEEQCDTT